MGPVRQKELEKMPGSGFRKKKKGSFKEAALCSLKPSIQVARNLFLVHAV